MKLWSNTIMIQERPIAKRDGSPPRPAGRSGIVGHVGPRPMPLAERPAPRWRSRVGYAVARWWDSVGSLSDDFFFVLEESDVLADLEYGRD